MSASLRPQRLHCQAALSSSVRRRLDNVRSLAMHNTAFTCAPGTPVCQALLFRCNALVPLPLRSGPLGSTKALLNRLDDGPGRWTTDVAGHLGDGVWNREAEREDLGRRERLCAPDAEPDRSARTRRRRVHQKGGREHATASTSVRVGVQEALVHVPAAELSLVVQLVLRIDGDARCGPAPACLDENVWNHTGVRRVRRRVQDDRPVAALVVNAYTSAGEQPIYEAEDERLEEPVHVDQESEGARLTWGEQVPRAETVEKQPRKSMGVPVVLVEAMVGDPTAYCFEVQLVDPADLLEDGQQPPHSPPDGPVGDARRASAQRCRQKLVLHDVLLVLVEATDEPVHLPEPPPQLLIAKETTPHDGKVVLALNVVCEEAATQ